MLFGCFVQVLYYLLHFWGCTSPFPTHAEGRLWLLSCAVITTSLLPQLFVVLWDKIALIPDEFFERHPSVAFLNISELEEYVYHSTVSDMIVRGIYLLLCLYLVLLVLCRSFLTVEAFIALRNVDEAVFRTVPWSDYWPHC